VRRAAAFACVVVVGLVLGAAGMMVLDDAVRESPARADRTQRVEPAPDASIAASEQVLLVWTPNGLPVDLAATVAALPNVTVTSEVQGDLVEMVASTASDGAAVDTTAAGYVIPLDALAVDPATYAQFVPKGAAAVFGALKPGEVILGETSARLRRVDVGGTIVLASGEQLRVAAVLGDALVGGAEIVVPRGTLGAITTPRFLLVTTRGARSDFEAAVRAQLPATVAVRFRAPGEAPLLRHGDAVLAQAVVKEQFGEFAYRHAGGRDLDLDPTWVRDHVVAVDLPLLGQVRCHRAIVGDLRATLLELERANLGYVVSPGGVAGCFVPRLISPDGGLSRHAWGIAIDLNWPKNLQGELGTQDVRLVEALVAHGFAWGGPWLVPDPAHFEWVGGKQSSSGR
jgi:hypothetical protein